MNEIELAWAAGFFDGEGSVGSYASGRNFYKENAPTYPKVSIASTDKSLLDKFQEVTGLGKVYGPRQIKQWKPRYDYRLDGRDKVSALYLLLVPYLGQQKREDFEKSLNYGIVAEQAYAVGSNPALKG